MGGDKTNPHQPRHYYVDTTNIYPKDDFAINSSSVPKRNTRKGYGWNPGLKLWHLHWFSWYNTRGRLSSIGLTSLFLLPTNCDKTQLNYYYFLTLMLCETTT